MEETNQKVTMNISRNEEKGKLGASTPILNIFLLLFVIIFVGVNQFLVEDINKKLGITSI